MGGCVGFSFILDFWISLNFANPLTVIVNDGDSSDAGLADRDVRSSAVPQHHVEVDVGLELVVVYDRDRDRLNALRLFEHLPNQHEGLRRQLFHIDRMKRINSYKNTSKMFR